MWQNSEKQNVTKLQNSICDKIKKNLFVTKLKTKKLWQNLKTEIVTVVLVTVAVVTVIIVTSFSKNDLPPQQPMRCSQGSFLRFSWCFHKMTTAGVTAVRKKTLNSEWSWTSDLLSFSDNPDDPGAVYCGLNRKTEYNLHIVQHLARKQSVAL